MDKEKLKKQIQLLSEKINNDVYEQRKHLIGKILTIVDATAQDPEQRKAIKDMVNDAFYGQSYWNHISEWISGFAKANGIEKLYDYDTLQVPQSDDNHAKSMFEKV